MYSYFYRFLQKLIVKRSFNEDLIKLIDKNKVNEIIDIGCADSSILEYINSSYSYHGYEVNSYFTDIVFHGFIFIRHIAARSI